MDFVEINGIEICYHLAGQGPRLLFINGTGADLRQRPSVFEGPLADNFELLSFDQRGLGRSGRPDEPYTMAGYAADAAGLLQALGWSRCAVMGYSFGGMVAQELAISRPEMVARLALVSTSSGGKGGSSFPLHELAHMPPEEMLRRFLEVVDIRRDRAWQEAHPKQWAELVDGHLEQMKIGAGEPNRALGAKRQLEARLGHDTFDRLGLITAPTLVCGGRFDGVVPLSNHQALTDNIPGAQLMIFEGGHGFFEENPALLEPIMAFLKG